MSNNFKNLQLKTISHHLANINICERPNEGWISAVRKSLGMNVRQLAERIGITQQAASKFEQNEIEEVITIKSLRKVAEALGCKLVYAIIPESGKLEDIIHKQAIKKARELVAPVNHTMLLEGQEVGNFNEKIIEIANELTKNPNSKLWE